jgi:hypothetical protein
VPTYRFDHWWLADHFQKHGAEVGAATEEEYEELASQFWESPLGPQDLACVDSQQNSLRYNAGTSQFVVVSAANVIRTYHLLKASRTKTALQRFHEKCSR